MLWIAACQAPLSMGFSRQENWSAATPQNTSVPELEEAASTLPWSPWRETALPTLCFEALVCVIGEVTADSHRIPRLSEAPWEAP